jgi:hypothetical protein
VAPKHLMQLPSQLQRNQAIDHRASTRTALVPARHGAGIVLVEGPGAQVARARGSLPRAQVVRASSGRARADVEILSGTEHAVRNHRKTAVTTSSTPAAPSSRNSDTAASGGSLIDAGLIRSRQRPRTGTRTGRCSPSAAGMVYPPRRPRRAQAGAATSRGRRRDVGRTVENATANTSPAIRSPPP